MDIIEDQFVRCWSAPEWMIMDRLAPFAIAKSGKGCIVDIGIGSSTEILAIQAKRYDIKQYSVDTNGNICERHKNRNYHSKHIIYHGKSLDFIKEFNDIPSLILLDGKHGYNNIMKEANFFLSIMPVNSMMFIHDTMPMEGAYERKIETKGKEMDTYKVRQELEMDNTLEVFTWPYGVGFTMVLKKDMNKPFYRL